MERYLNFQPVPPNLTPIQVSEQHSNEESRSNSQFVTSFRIYCATDSIGYACSLKYLTVQTLVLRTTIMTPVKPQISKFQADKSCQVDFNVLRRLYSSASVRRVKSSVHDGVVLLFLQFLFLLSLSRIIRQPLYTPSRN
jgi:hypothetical protein